jgi:hypothetical protein
MAWTFSGTFVDGFEGERVVVGQTASASAPSVRAMSLTGPSGGGVRIESHPPHRTVRLAAERAHQ